MMKLADPDAHAPVRLRYCAMDGARDSHDIHGRNAVVRIMLNGRPGPNRGQLFGGHASVETQADDHLSVRDALRNDLQSGLERKRAGQVRDGDGDVFLAGPACQGPGRVWCRTNSAPKLNRKGRKTTHGIHSVFAWVRRVRSAEGRQR